MSIDKACTGDLIAELMARLPRLGLTDVLCNLEEA